MNAFGEAGDETPIPIQAGAVPATIEGHDVLATVQTGTCKTASCSLPMKTMPVRRR